MLSNVFLKSLRDQRRSMVWWVIGMVLLTLITVLFYPSIKDLPDLNDLLGDSDSITRVFVGDIEDLTSPEGFLNSQLYFLLVPLVFLVFAVALGSGAIAGEERKGTLDLLLSYPLTRRSVLLQKFASMALATIALAFVVWLAVIIGAALVSMELSLLRAGEATFSATILAIGFGTLALAIGSATGNTGLSLGLTGAIAVATYFINALAPIADIMESLRVISPFYYYIGTDPITNGLNLVHVAVLVGLTAVLLGAGVVTFERRDLAV